MQNEEVLQLIMKSSGFRYYYKDKEWRRDDVVVRFLDKKMEIFENPDLKGNTRYLIADIDSEYLIDILKDVFN